MTLTVFGFDTPQECFDFAAALDREGVGYRPADGGWTPPGASQAVPQYGVAVLAPPGVLLRDLGRAFRQAAALVVRGDLARGFAGQVWDLAADTFTPPCPLVPGRSPDGWTTFAGRDWTLAPASRPEVVDPLATEA